MGKSPEYLVILVLLSMVVGDLNVVDTIDGPREADSILVVYSDRVLPLPIAREGMQLKAWPRL
jgi:hypothetical protein